MSLEGATKDSNSKTSTLHSGQMEASSESSENDGFSLIESIVSLFLLGILATVIAATLTQTILATSRNAVLAALSQTANAEVSRIHREVINCEDLGSLLQSTSETQVLVAGKIRSVSADAEPIGWTICGQNATGIYPIRVTLSADSDESFVVETLVVLK